MLEHESDRYANLDWSQKRKRPKKAIWPTFRVKEFSEFVGMCDDIHKDKILEYEFNYNRLLCLFSNLKSDSYSDMAESALSEDEDDLFPENGVSALEAHNATQYFILTYYKAINDLINGKSKEAVTALEKLARQNMPHAVYAFAIIKFKDMYVNNVKHERPDQLILDLILWLNFNEHNNSLNPLNKSLFLKVQLYNIGGYGEQVKRLTGSVNVLIWDILSVTEGTELEFDENLYRKSSFVTRGTEIGNTVEERNDLVNIIAGAAYELLKQKMLQSSPHTAHTAMKDAFQKISKSLPKSRRRFSVIAKMSNYLSAEVRYGHAINLLMYRTKQENKEAIGLLNESCKLGHRTAPYLRGSLLFRHRCGFGFIYKEYDQSVIRAMFYGLEEFALRYHDETAVRMVVGEYMRRDSYFVIQNAAKGQEILKGAGLEHIYKEFCPKSPVSPSKGFDRSVSRISSQLDKNATLKRRLDPSTLPTELPPKRQCFTLDSEQVNESTISDR